MLKTLEWIAERDYLKYDRDVHVHRTFPRQQQVQPSNVQTAQPWPQTPHSLK
jgi:hypothetical protein